MQVIKGSLVFQVHYHTAYFLSLQVIYTPICKHLTLPMQDFIHKISIDCQAPLYLIKIRSGCCRRSAKALKWNLDKWLFYSFYVTHICFLCHHFHKQKPPNVACCSTKLRTHSINCFSFSVTSFSLFLSPSSFYPVVIISRQLDIAYFSLSPSCFKRTVNSTRLCLSQNGVEVHDGFQMAAF